MSNEQIERAIATLRAAGHLIEAIPGIAGVYRVDERGARTDEELLAMVAQLGARLSNGVWGWIGAGET